MNEASGQWVTTTHDWTKTIDIEHLAQVRHAPDVFAPGGAMHLLLEVLAYVADEAESPGSNGYCLVTLHADGSVSVADNGRGTETRYDDGKPIRKPVMATKDVRFFDSSAAQRLPDGYPRRGMSTVAALSRWLVHTNRRPNGAWQQRYEHGIPVTELLTIPGQDTTGTTVHFLLANGLRPMPTDPRPRLEQLTTTWPQLVIDVVDQRSS